MSSNRKQISNYRQIGLVSGLALWSVAIGNTNCAFAQITPDQTLGNENSQVDNNAFIQGLPSAQINGGATRGANLFHSFQQFNVEQGWGAYFTNPSGIANIFSRVTGTNPSSILGRLGVLGNANLFLINPNGIIFGQNASLDVNGSFVATTANAIGFGEQGFFSASAPNIPPVLSVNPSVFLFNQIGTGAIANNSTAPAGLDPSGTFSTFGIRVPDSRSLVLLGGNVSLNSGGIVAFGGQVELGAVAGTGTVGLNFYGNNLSLSFPDSTPRADVSLTNGAGVIVGAGDKGSIFINAKNLDISNGSTLTGGIGAFLGSANSQAGNITLNATGTVTIKDLSLILSNVEHAAQGISGNINITADSLFLSNGGQLQAGIRGSSTTLPGGNGQSGNININVRDRLTLEGIFNNSFPSGIFGDVEFGAVGNGGNVNIKAGSISLTDSAVIRTSTAGEGNAGSISIEANDSVFLTAGSQIRSAIEFGGKGNGGDISIKSSSFSLTDAAQLNASTFGQGNAGTITLQVNNSVSLTDRSLILSNIEYFGQGNGGNINITAGSLSLISGGQVQSGIRGGLGLLLGGKGESGNININVRDRMTITGTSETGSPSGIFADVEFGAVGNGGNVNIKAGSLSITDGGVIVTSTAGEGNAGNIFIQTDDLVEVVGTTPTGNFSSLSAEARGEVNGRGGDLTIETRRLSVRDGAQVSASTFGVGDSGNLTVRASESIQLSGEGSFPGGLFAQVNPGARGNGGNLTIDTRNLSISDGSKIQVSTFGQGDAGDLLIRATDVEVFETPIDNFYSTGIFAEVARIDAKGMGGNLTIDTERLRIRNGGQVSTSTLGEGNAGSLFIRASDLVEVSGVENPEITQGFRSQSLLTADVREGGKGSGGNLIIETGRLNVSGGGQVSVKTSGEGDAGVLQIRSQDSVEVVGKSTDGQFQSEISAAVGQNSTGRGGNLNLETAQLTISDGAVITSRSEGQNSAGNIFINVRGRFQANNGIISTNSTRSGGGNIFINASDIRLVGDSDIRTDVFSGTGGGGNVDITANSIIALNDSDILAFARDGKGGNITLNTPAFFGNNYRPAPANTDPRSLDDNNRVDVNASGAVAGIITLPDVSFIQNSLTELPQVPLDPNTLIANSCIARSNQKGGSFTNTGAGGLPTRPGDAAVSPYPTGNVRSLPQKSDRPTSPQSSLPNNRPIHQWQLGDPIIEPHGAYQLPNGQMILSRQCS